MNQQFQGWAIVAAELEKQASAQQLIAEREGESSARLNQGQRASLRALAERIGNHGVVIADEVGMGKTRIAVELARAVKVAGGRVAILVPPGLGYQWQTELKDGGIESPPILRSLLGYLSAWEAETHTEQKPWFAQSALIISHTFTNWRLGQAAQSWRWSLLPEIYARWRAAIEGRLPRGYHGYRELDDTWVRRAAQSITGAIPERSNHPGRTLLAELMDAISWPQPMNAVEYSRDGLFRDWLERIVGLGLGSFELVIIDEAHKSRGTDSGLSRLLDSVILPSDSCRRLALTATPVELDVSQWQQTLNRIGLPASLQQSTIQPAITAYAQAVNDLRAHWRSSPKVRETYQVAAARFERALSPFLLRRDKREDADVLRYQQHSGTQGRAYRNTQVEIAIETKGLPSHWREAICATEAMSLVSRQSENPEAKRLRLTLGNGHGIADLMAQTVQETLEPAAVEIQISAVNPVEAKRQARVQWWLNVARNAFAEDQDGLFGHPAILAAVEAIEEAAGAGEKTLVFGRFTQPMRALVGLLNAREMLRRLEDGRHWPQTKVHGERNGAIEANEWPAVLAAHRQLNSSIDLATLDAALQRQYDKQSRRRDLFRGQLTDLLERGLQAIGANKRQLSMFGFLFRAAHTTAIEKSDDKHPVATFARAIADLIGEVETDQEPSLVASAFCQLIDAAGDQDSEDVDGEKDDPGAERWESLVEQLHQEYARPEGGFARLMYGGTAQASRRMLQLAFNRQNSFPRVLVAQSMVGREGLNLHLACRTVVLMHPEWNPGVVEQQIGRVDRVGSHWSRQLNAAISEGARGLDLPRIDVRPVIFKGTYDEHNWNVLQQRWDDLRAQLHGEVIAPQLANEYPEYSSLAGALSLNAPNFSPNRSD